MDGNKKYCFQLAIFALNETKRKTINKVLSAKARRVDDIRAEIFLKV